MAGLLNLFARSKKYAAKTSSGSAENSPVSMPAAIELQNERAVGSLVKLLTRLSETDEVLRQAGLRRWHLRALETDDEIWQALDTRSDALAATPVTLKPRFGKPTEETELLQSIVMENKPSLSRAVFAARKYGYSVAEAVYCPKFYNSKKAAVLVNWGVKFIGEKPMEWFDPRPDGELRFFPANGQSSPEGVVVDTNYKFFLTRCNATYRQPQGEALLSRLYWPWWFRTQGWKFWGKFLERFGAPLLVGRSTNNEAMVAALLEAHSQAVIGISREDNVEAVGVPSGNSGQTFELYEAAVIRRIQKVILGQTLTSGTDGGSGNRALGQVHDSVRKDKRNSDVQLALPTFQKFVDALTQLNNWPPHEIVFEDDVGLNTQQATRDKDLHAQGVRFRKTYYQSNFNLDSEDFDLTADMSEGGASPPGQEQNGQPADGTPAGKAKSERSPKSTKASLDSSLLFIQRSKKSRFTKQQVVVEELGDEAMNRAGLPLSEEALRSAIAAASSPEDLGRRLFALLDDEVSQEEFNEVLEKSLFAASVLGYVHAEGKV